MPAQDNKKGAQGNASFPASAGANAKKRHKGKGGKGNGQNVNNQQNLHVKKENKPAHVKQERKDGVKIKQAMMERNDVKAISQAPKNAPENATATKTKTRKKAHRKAKKAAGTKNSKSADKVSTKQEETEKPKEVKAKKARKTAAAAKENPRGIPTRSKGGRDEISEAIGQKEAKTTSIEVAISAAGLKKRKEELDAREQDPIQQSYAYDKKEKEDASKKAAKKLEDRKLKAEAKADRAAAKVAKRMERVERRQQANKEGNFNVLKPVFAGIIKKKASSKSKVPLKLSRLSADQERGDEEGEEGGEAVDDSEPSARPKLSHSVDGSPTVVTNQDDENEVDIETMEPSKTSISSATAAPVFSAPTLSTAVRPEADCTATESSDLTTLDPTEDFAGIPIKRYTEARKYFDERKQLAAEMKKMVEKLKKLSAREAFIEARISDMRRPVTATATATNGKLSCKRDKKPEPNYLSRGAPSKSTLSAS
ncbi:hypothetical protein LZ554_007730 [Drepanopeziza brunnea f. sp. 'monogermtubi']|nr:hypothetical protein LZ554_007730 [Drepanopeziza brunnea f. sp. 'monogermtubi']